MYNMIWWCRCSFQMRTHTQGSTMKWTLSFWEQRLGSHIRYRPMCMYEEVAMATLLGGRWSSTCGSTRPKISITMPLYGILEKSCKHYFIIVTISNGIWYNHAWYQKSLLEVILIISGTIHNFTLITLSMIHNCIGYDWCW